MQIVIEIPESVKQAFDKATKDDVCGGYYDCNGIIGRAIQNGVPLPKGHGRIGDLDALEQEMINGIKAGNYEDGYDDYSHINDMDDCVDCVRYADTIIEADKEESEGT